MKKSKFTETQIVSILKQADAGVPIKDICRQAGISVPTYYQWKSKYGGMEANEVLRGLETNKSGARAKRHHEVASEFKRRHFWQCWKFASSISMTDDWP